ncbi:MAG TPA: hypothetical protein VJL08_02495, partial [Dehalococcoidia bacterium]|nr:hypothetical protein [Dehalococcoidia bacterium]
MAGAPHAGGRVRYDRQAGEPLSQDRLYTGRYFAAEDGWYTGVCAQRFDRSQTLLLSAMPLAVQYL